MEDQLIETIPLTRDRYLGVAWKEGCVHSLCLATNEAMAEKAATWALQRNPAKDEVFENIEKLVQEL